MIRCAAAIAVVLCLSPAPLWAQSTVFTVSTESASVYKSPSTGSPVIGKARRGAKLEVTRELGSWVKVVWPPALDSVGYVHVSMGSIARGPAPAPIRPSTNAAGRPAAGAASSSAPAARPEPMQAAAPPVPPQMEYVRPPSHVLGVGGEVGGPTFRLGATARAWSRERLGIQVEMSRDAAIDAPGRMTSVDVTPSVLYALPDRVTDYVWVRPYVGAGPSLQWQTFNGGMPGVDSASENRFGFRAFGGGEVTFASVPRFAVSADLGYRWFPTSFAGFDAGGVGLTVSGHWYIR